MSRVTRVLWTITPLEAPQPWRSCSRCGAARPFRCSGKFRLNANGKRLDAWLVYKCVDCDTTWNRTIFERRADISPAMLTALQENNAALAAQFAFDIAGLRREAHHVETFGDVAVHKTVLSEEVASVSSVEITLAVSVATAVRLDRLLSSELGLSRSRIAAMAQAGHLTALCHAWQSGARWHDDPDCGDGCLKIGSSAAVPLSREPHLSAAAVLSRRVFGIGVRLSKNPPFLGS